METGFGDKRFQLIVELLKPVKVQFDKFRYQQFMIIIRYPDSQLEPAHSLLHYYSNTLPYTSNGLSSDPVIDHFSHQAPHCLQSLCVDYIQIILMCVPPGRKHRLTALTPAVVNDVDHWNVSMTIHHQMIIGYE